MTSTRKSGVSAVGPLKCAALATTGSGTLHSEASTRSEAG